MTRDLEHATYVVTGSNTGIGRVTAVTLARRGAHVVLANRSSEKTAPVLDEIRAAGGSAEFVELDLSDLDATRTAAQRLLELPRIDALVNNAGLAGFGGKSAQGYELTFAVNHLGPFVLTEWLLPKLVASRPSRVVFVASRAHFRAPAIDWDALRAPTNTTTGFREYSVSKLCNVLYAKELAGRHAPTDLCAYALHPGVVASDVWRDIPAPFRAVMKLFMLSNEQGARTSLFCATDPSVAEQTGLYYDECKVRKSSAASMDPALAAELVARSREWAADFLPLGA